MDELYLLIWYNFICPCPISYEIKIGEK